ncbi:MAG: group II intron reverse transcriptase/maturase, partial [Chloroflexota bacterium]|nr:group II intron reverse transcriptase/maturase [Chloroflexota bacterium]
MSESKPDGKPFVISKRLVWEAWQRVKANRGAAGVDEESIAEFESDLKGNLYKLWNRMSSGSYMPPPVRAVEIPKKGGHGVRVLGVPTVADRVAQTVARLYLEPEVEPVFHPDSYGYRPRRSAHDALRTCRTRCWKYDWAIDLDLRAFFDSLDHSLVLRSVAHHTDLRWILLYVERWLKAPLQLEDDTLKPRDRGSPQGSAISPVLANIFLHYALDLWVLQWRKMQARGEMYVVRYADDFVMGFQREAEARAMRAALAERLETFGLELHPDKTRVIRFGRFAHRDSRLDGRTRPETFDFLGFTHIVALDPHGVSRLIRRTSRKKRV